MRTYTISELNKFNDTIVILDEELSGISVAELLDYSTENINEVVTQLLEKRLQGCVDFLLIHPQPVDETIWEKLCSSLCVASKKPWGFTIYNRGGIVENLWITKFEQTISNTIKQPITDVQFLPSEFFGFHTPIAMTANKDLVSQVVSYMDYNNEEFFYLVFPNTIDVDFMCDGFSYDSVSDYKIHGLTIVKILLNLDD